MENQDLFSRLKEYATGLEGELKSAMESKEMWTRTASAPYIGGKSIQERFGIQDTEYSIRVYSKVLTRLYEAFPEVKTVAEFYQEFPNLKFGDENDRQR